MTEPDTIAILGLGEAGTAIASGLRGESRWDGDVFAIDTARDLGEKGRGIRERGAAVGIEVFEDYGQFLAGVDLVFSVVTGEEALNAATAARPHLKTNAVYLDLCTITRDMAITNAAALDGSGARYVDVAVMGMFHNFGHRAPMLLAGRDAAEVATWMRSAGLEPTVLSSRVGDASAVKLLRSVVMKGLEALGVECLVAAERQCLRPEVLDCFADLDSVSFADYLGKLVTTHLVHAERRLGEMELVAQMLRETRMEPVMTEAICRSHRRTLAAGNSAADGVVPELEAALKILSERVMENA